MPKAGNSKHKTFSKIFFLIVLAPAVKNLSRFFTSKRQTFKKAVKVLDVHSLKAKPVFTFILYKRLKKKPNLKVLDAVLQSTRLSSTAMQLSAVLLDATHCIG